MRREVFLLGWVVLAALLLGASRPASAHDKKLHEGHPLAGVVSAVSENGFTLKTDASESSVEVSAETEIKRDGVPAARDALRIGEHVEVVGPKLPGGAVAASEISVHSGKDPKPTTEE